MVKSLIISFHSIEDKIVKYLFTNFSKNKSKPSRYFPDNNVQKLAFFNEYKNKVFRPSKKRNKNNNRSRSAKLRFATRRNNKFQFQRLLSKNLKNT